MPIKGPPRPKPEPPPRPIEHVDQTVAARRRDVRGAGLDPELKN